MVANFPNGYTAHPAPQVATALPNVLSDVNWYKCQYESIHKLVVSEMAIYRLESL